MAHFGVSWTIEEKHVLAKQLTLVMLNEEFDSFKNMFVRVQNVLPVERRRKGITGWTHIDDVIALCSEEVQTRIADIRSTGLKRVRKAKGIIWTDEEKEAFSLAYWGLRSRRLTNGEKSKIAMHQVLPLERHRGYADPMQTGWFKQLIAFFEAEELKKAQAKMDLMTPVVNPPVAALEIVEEPKPEPEEISAAMEYVPTEEYIDDHPEWPQQTAEPQLTFEEVLADSIARVVVRAARSAMPQITEMLKQSLLNSMMAPAPDKPSSEHHHNPKPSSPPKPHRPKVLVAGLRQDQKAMLLTEYEKYFDLRIWTDDETPAMLREMAKHADYGIAQTSKMSHANYHIIKQTLHGRSKTLIAEKGGIDMIRNTLNTLANGALQTH